MTYRCGKKPTDTGRTTASSSWSLTRCLAINALRLDGIWSITERIADLGHDIKGLLGLLVVA